MEEEEEESGGGAGWLVSFADLMTLLFAAFVVLYGITPQGKSDVMRGVSSSIKESFIEIPDDIPEDFRTGEVFKGKQNFKAAQRDSQRTPVIKRFNRVESILRDRNKDLQRLDIMLNQSKGNGIHYSLRQATDVSEYEFGIKLKLIAKSYFEPGSGLISNAGRNKLNLLIPKMEKLNKRLTIEGHTSISAASGRLSPFELSALRASNVRRYILDNSNIKESMIYTAAYGDSRPRRSNRTRAGRNENSRVEIKLIYQDQERY